MMTVMRMPDTAKSMWRTANCSMHMRMWKKTMRRTKRRMAWISRMLILILMNKGVTVIK